MPIAPYRHNLPKSDDGKDWFIIRTPRPISRNILNVRFTDGEGRTKFEQKAKVFAEQFNYECILPAGHPGFEFVNIKSSQEPDRFEWEYQYDLVDEEGDEVEDFNAPKVRGKLNG